MPSGSHGGSPGSHSSGGSSSRGSSSGGRGGMSGPGGMGGPGRMGGPGGMGGPGMHGFRGGRGHFHFGWGGHYYVVEGGRGTLASFLMAFVWIAFFVAIILTPFLISNKSYVSKKERDYVYYQDMIINAEEKTDYQLEGQVVSKYCSFGKYYITYTFKDKNGNEIAEEGYTFSIFTLEEASKLVRDETIVLAMEHKKNSVTKDSDSIPMVCKDYKLTDDAEYNYYNRRVKIEIAVEVIVCIVFFVSLISMIVIVSKYKEDTDSSSKMRSTTISNRGMTSDESTCQTTNKVDEGWICPYCGCRNSSQRKTCSGCGSTRR